MTDLSHNLLEGVPDLDSPYVPSSGSGLKFYVLHKYYAREKRVKPFQAFASRTTALSAAASEMGIYAHQLEHVEIVKRGNLTIICHKRKPSWGSPLTVIEEIGMPMLPEGAWKPALDAMQPEEDD